MKFSRQEYKSGLPIPAPEYCIVHLKVAKRGDLKNPHYKKKKNVPVWCWMLTEPVVEIMLHTYTCVCMHAQLLQLGLTLCYPMYHTLSGFSAYGILPARILEWVAIPSSRVSFQPRDQTCIPCIAGKFFTTEPQGKPYIYIYQIVMWFT